MTYKDPDKQREAQRDWVRQKRANNQGSTKRGKDIKVFADLSPDVQRTIDSMSTVDGKIFPTVKARRTKIAIHYRTTCFGYQGM